MLDQLTFVPWKLRREAVLALEVGESQRRFLSDHNVAEFLAADDDHPTFASYAVCDGDVVVGFASFGRETAHAVGQWWIPLLLVDKQYQLRGYGRALIHGLIERIRHQDPRCTEIGLSCKRENDAALRLYREAGFVERSSDDRGGVEMWLTLS